MKILVLHPQIEMVRPIVQALEAEGAVVLSAIDSTEAWQQLQFHGSGIGIVLLSREGKGGQGEAGLELLGRIRKDAFLGRTPVIVLSAVWQELQFARHQEGKDSANAYFAIPADPAAVVVAIQKIVPLPLRSERFEAVLDAARRAAAQAHRAENSSTDTRVPTGEGLTGGIILEEVSSVFKNSLLVERSDTSIRLELPPEALNPPTAVVDVQEQAEAARRTAELEARERDEAQAAEAELPYLFGQEGGSLGSGSYRQRASAGMPGIPPGGFAAAGTPGASWGIPLGAAVVPGGTLKDPDAETIRHYLELREQDVAVLSAQLRAAMEEVAAGARRLEAEQARVESLEIEVSRSKQHVEDVERDKTVAVEAARSEVAQLQFQLRTKSDKVRNLELQIQEAAGEIEKIKDRVRQDVRRIRTREKELENRLEIMKKDSEALLGSREGKLLELKRKLDSVEFTMELLQEQLVKEREFSARLKEQLGRVAQAVRVAGGLLDVSPILTEAVAAAAASAGVAPVISDLGTATEIVSPSPPEAPRDGTLVLDFVDPDRQAS